jgi:tetratricopeptide (TPR) repeat protein
MDPSREDFEPRPGSRAGAYQLVKKVGSGYFGVVYLGRADDGSEVALKLLRGPCGHDEEVFKQELQGLTKAANASPGARVVRLVAAWREAGLGGCYCLATAPYCSGGNLEERIRDSAAPLLSTRLGWALQVAETLLVLHTTSGVRLVHGDLTLRNVALCVGSGGLLELYVLDLGVARHNHPHGSVEPQKQQSTSVAPEMEQGSGKFDQTADVWSWGVLLHALLSWSLVRMGGAEERAWFEGLPERPRAEWEEELQGPTPLALHIPGGAEDMKQGHMESWIEVLDVMVDCLRPRDQRVGMETVVYVMRRALGYHEPPSKLVWLENQLREGRARGGLDAPAEVNILVDKAEAHAKLQQHVDAHVCLVLAEKIGRQRRSTPHRAFARCTSALAKSYFDRGESELAMPLHEEALAMHRAALPPGHLDIANSLNNLAAVQAHRGQYDRALPLLEEALAMRRAALPPGHPDIATSLNNLASVHKSKGKYDRALPLYEEALAIYRAALPPGHPLIAASLNSLAYLHDSKGEYDRALSLYEEALAIYRAALPPGHPDIAISLNNLASLHHSKGEYDQALPLYEEALATYRAALPPGHPDIASSLNNLAGVHHSKGEYDRALPLYEEALATYRAALPPGHPDIASSLNNLATLLYSKGEYDRALPLLEEALAIERATLPPGHPDIAFSLNNLAAVHKSKGDYDCALPLHEEALAMRRAALPPGHPLIASSLNNIASLHNSKGEYDRALPLYEEALAMRRAALPPGHPDIASSLNNIATVHESKGEYGRALPLYEEALAMRRVALPPGHPDIASSLNNLASLQHSKGE